MLARALFLRKAIDQFVGDEDEESDKDGHLSMYKLTKKEWDQAGVIVTILLPFKLTSVRLQATKRPGIDSVFWEYESLFNKIDSIKSTFTRPEYRAKEWIQELHAGVEKLSEKLQEYYSRTEHAFVYSDACILEPQGKLILFNRINLWEIQRQIGPVNTSKNVEKDLSIAMKPHQLSKQIIQGSTPVITHLTKMKSAIIGRICTGILGYWRPLKMN